VPKAGGDRSPGTFAENMSRVIYQLAGIVTSLLIAGWALSRFDLLIAVVFTTPPILLTFAYLVTKRSSCSNSGLSAGYIGSLLGCLLLPLLDLFRPYYASASWFGPIAIAFSVIIWPFVICIAGVIGVGVEYIFSRPRHET
jgi:hypothetical protein